jgi:beta-glucosidase
MTNPDLHSGSSSLDSQVESLLSQLTLKEKVALLSGRDAWNTVLIERLGIPSLTMTDGPHGVRADQAESGRRVGPTTAFPTGSALAATWNPALVERVGAALAEETLAMGCDILLGPCVNIVRHPLAGRNFESYSEDPYLAGRIGVAFVRGVQGRNVGTSLKHFACNNQEFEKTRGSSTLDERTLHEIYLPHFEAVVKEAQPWMVMCAYNRVNSVYVSQNQHLLTDILKEDWGFQGAVISDWGANHTTVDSMQAGLDLEMPGPATYYGRLLMEAMKNWQVDEARIDDASRRLLRLIIRSGKMDGDQRRAAGSVNTREHQQLARAVAEDAIVLLKNEARLLPLRTEDLHSIAVIGPNAAEMCVSGGGSAYVEPPYKVSPLDGLLARLGEQVNVTYEQGCDNYVELPILKQDFLTPTGGTGHGLRAEYFSGTDLSGTADLERVDAKINFWWWWHDSSPDESISPGRFAGRWTSGLTVPETGHYTLRLVNTGTGRLFLDGRLLLEHGRRDGAPADEPLRSSSADVELTGEREYALRVEFIRDIDDGFAHIGLHFARKYRPSEDNRLERAAAIARQSDVAVVFAGMPNNYETEGGDRPDLELPGLQTELIRTVVQVNPKTVVVLNCGAPVTMPWIRDVPAVLLAHYPGLEGGHAIAKLLLGEVNPSGRLSVTWPKRLQDTPAFVNYPGGREVYYGEGIFVGYRSYDQRDLEPLFPFGHGLSYTSFEYGDLQAPETMRVGETVRVSLTMRNCGDRAGHEVVQLYVSDRQASVTRPPKELKGFAKVFLEPGETQAVHFDLNERAFAFYDPARRRWLVEAGEFEILVGSSSRDIRARTTIQGESVDVD